jgi:hypothetical protein
VRERIVPSPLLLPPELDEELLEELDELDDDPETVTMKSRKLGQPAAFV